MSDIPSRSRHTLLMNILLTFHKEEHIFDLRILKYLIHHGLTIGLINK